MDIQKILENIEPGLKKYQAIMNEFKSGDVTKMEDFQRHYVGFFKMRRDNDFRKEYFSLMQANRNNKDLTFEDILNHLYKKFNRIEPSFSSKMLSVINPNMPVWDSEVLKNLKIKAPSNTMLDSQRIQQTIAIYNDICDWFDKKLKSIEGKDWIKEFDNHFPNSGITDEKKIDLILWQTRECAMGQRQGKAGARRHALECGGEHHIWGRKERKEVLTRVARRKNKQLVKDVSVED